MSAKKTAHFLIAVKEQGPFAVLVLRAEGEHTEYDSIELPRPAAQAEPVDAEAESRAVLWAVSHALVALGLDPAEMAQSGWAEPDMQVLTIREDLSFDELRQHWQKSKVPSLTSFKVGDA
jgi:hypothetical protein